MNIHIYFIIIKLELFKTRIEHNHYNNDSLPLIKIVQYILRLDNYLLEVFQVLIS